LLVRGNQVGKPNRGVRFRDFQTFKQARQFFGIHNGRGSTMDKFKKNHKAANVMSSRHPSSRHH
jgi:hypothetical protein